MLYNTIINGPSHLTISLENSQDISDYFFSENQNNNTISITGSGIAGHYLPTLNNQNEIIFIGNSGGNLTGNPDIMYLNIKGNIELSNRFNNNKGKLQFTGLLQIIIIENLIEVSLINQFAKIYLSEIENTLISNSIIFNNNTFILSNNLNTINYSQCNRYINLGDLQLKFIY